MLPKRVFIPNFIMHCFFFSKSITQQNVSDKNPCFFLCKIKKKKGKFFFVNSISNENIYIIIYFVVCQA